MCPYALVPMVGVGPHTLSSSWPGCFISTLLSLALVYLYLCSPHTGSQPDILYPCFNIYYVACKEAVSFHIYKLLLLYRSNLVQLYVHHIQSYQVISL